MAEARECDLEFSFTTAIRGLRLSISSLTVKDAEVQITVGASSLQRKTSSADSSYSSPSLSNYTRTTGVKIYLLSIQRRTTVFIIIFDRLDN